MGLFIFFCVYIITLFFLFQAHSKILSLENEILLDQPHIYGRAKENFESRLSPSIKLLNQCVQDIRYLSYRHHIKLGEVKITEVDQDDVFRVSELQTLCKYLYSHIQDFKLKQEVDNG